MIYIVIGPSCSGKSTFVVNSFIKGKNAKETKDILTLCETDTCFLIGKWFDSRRVKGLDRISRAQIPLITKQVKKLIPKNKNIVLEGDKVVSQKIFRELLNTGEKCKLFWIRCSAETSLNRNRKNGSTQQESSIRAVATKAKNIFYIFQNEMDGEIVDTENVVDWDNFNLSTANRIKTRSNIDFTDFAVFILSHGRADNVVTYNTIRKHGYTGPIYLICDNEDDQLEEYKAKYGSGAVKVFDKQKTYDNTDTMDNFNERRAIIYARNESFKIAKSLGLKYFLQLDDDYSQIQFRWPEGGKLLAKDVHDLDTIIDSMLNFLIRSGALTVALCQNGDFLGGAQGDGCKKGLLRKTMNSFFCRTDTPIEFKGTMNEDVVTYTTEGSRGKLFLSLVPVAIKQIQTQSLSGGMTEAYSESGTYIKSFYAVMSMPSAVKISMLNSSNKRIHHKISWNNCVPKIISPKYRKEG